MENFIIHTIFPTPLGWCGIVKAGTDLIRIFLPESKKSAINAKIRLFYPCSVPLKTPFFEEIKELKKYFSGVMTNFSFNLNF